MLTASRSFADSLSRGSISVEARAFDPDGVEETEDLSLALTSRLEVKYWTGKWRASLRGFARLDALDGTRNIFVLEDAYVSYSLGRVSLSVGPSIINWSATEAFHPGDIINSRNFDSEFENLEKLGEPMAQLSVRLLQGELSAYYMPVRVAPSVLPSTSRLSFLPPGAELGDTLWIDRDGDASEDWFAHQGALRFSQTLGHADIALHLVDHSDRHQPTFTFDPESGALRPTYHSVTQLGLTYVHVLGSMLLKVEGAARLFRDPDEMTAPGVTAQADHGQLAAGLEYNWTTSAGHAATVIAEGQVLLEDRETRRQLHPFQGDVLFGYRHFFNDVNGREILLSCIVDVERPQEYVASARYTQAIGDFWSVTGTVRSLRLFGRDNHQILLVLTRSF